MHSWRSHCKPIIAEVLRETKGKSDKEIKKALCEAYPYGEKRRWPYTVWLDEIKRQQGKKRPSRSEAFEDGQ